MPAERSKQVRAKARSTLIVSAMSFRGSILTHVESSEPSCESHSESEWVNRTHVHLRQNLIYLGDQLRFIDHIDPWLRAPWGVVGLDQLTKSTRKWLSQEKPMGGTTVLEEAVLVEGTCVLSSPIDDVKATGCYE